MPTSKVTVYRNGQPISNIKVTLEYSGLAQNGFTTPAYTNSSGVAVISHRSTGKATIYVNGSQTGSMNTPGNDSVYL